LIIKKSNRLNRNGSIDIVRLDIHSSWGRLQDRIKAPTSDKVRGVMMKEVIDNRFNLNDEETKKIRDNLRQNEIKEAKEQFIDINISRPPRKPFSPSIRRPIFTPRKIKPLINPKISSEEIKKEIFQDINQKT